MTRRRMVETKRKGEADADAGTAAQVPKKTLLKKPPNGTKNWRLWAEKNVVGDVQKGH